MNTSVFDDPPSPLPELNTMPTSAMSPIYINTSSEESSDDSSSVYSYQSSSVVSAVRSSSPASVISSSNDECPEFPDPQEELYESSDIEERELNRPECSDIS